MRRYLVRRIAWTVFVTYLVLSAAFFVFAYTRDPNQRLTAFAAGADAAMNGENGTEAAVETEQAYIEVRNYDEPVLERYADWMVGYATLDWGWSYSRNKPVVDVIAERAPVTLVYLIPAVLLAVLAGVPAGLYAGANGGGRFDSLTATVAYVGLGLPAFWLGVWLPILAIERLGWYQATYDTRFGLWTGENLGALALPTVVVATSMFAVQLRYTRAESLEYRRADFVKTLRANGAGTRDVLRHVFRNAVLTLTSLFFAEVLAVLFVTIYVVEVVFGIPGIGQAAYRAIEARDIGLILATTFLPVLVGLLGNLLQDVVSAVLDPRIEADGG